MDFLETRPSKRRLGEVKTIYRPTYKTEKALQRGSRMKKKLAVLFSLLLATSISMSMTRSIQANISNYSWVETTYRGNEDPFFAPNYIVAYTAGSLAKLVVSVNSYVGTRPANVSAVKVRLDWGETYASTECSVDTPVQIEPDETRVFSVSFSVPPITTASNLVLHDYTIFVEYVNSTTGPKEIIYTETQSDDDFAVYSQEQADAMEVRTQLDAIFDHSPSFNSPKAEVLWSEAKAENATAVRRYEAGKFFAANASFYNALDLVDQALEAEDERGSALEDAQTNYFSAAMTQGYGRLLIGLGIVFIGIAAIIYAIKKPKVFPEV